MKKMMFGCTFMLIGTIGFVGTLVAANLLTAPGAYSCIYSSISTWKEYCTLSVFGILFLVGLVQSMKALKEE